MTARRSTIAAISAIALLLSVLAFPVTPVEANAKPKGLVIEGWKATGNTVYVSVTNYSSRPNAGTVTVDALVLGLPASGNVNVELGAGESRTVPVGFWGPVSGVVECIVDSSDPVG